MKPQGIPQKKPEAPPTPKPPPVTSLCLGKTTGGLHCVALVTTEELRVTAAKVLAVSRDASVIEEEWDARAYPILFHGEASTASVPHTLASGEALALAHAPGTLKSVRTATRLEIEGAKVIGQAVIFSGGKLDAWKELSDWAARHLLVESKATRRKRQG